MLPKELLDELTAVEVLKEAATESDAKHGQAEAALADAVEAEAKTKEDALEAHRTLSQGATMALDHLRQHFGV